MMRDSWLDWLSNLPVLVGSWVLDRIAGPYPGGKADRMRQRQEAEKVAVFPGSSPRDDPVFGRKGDQTDSTPTHAYPVSTHSYQTWGLRLTKLLSISQAAEQLIERVRLPIWADPMDHIKIDIIDGKPGPWLHLYAPLNKECNGRDPVDFLAIIGPLKTDIHSVEFEPYSGPLPESDEYRRRAAWFAGSLSR